MLDRELRREAYWGCKKEITEMAHTLNYTQAKQLLQMQGGIIGPNTVSNGMNDYFIPNYVSTELVERMKDQNRVQETKGDLVIVTSAYGIPFQGKVE